jgi:acyl-CoA dehydrogenase
MSVPYDRAFELLANSQNGHVSASERIPVIARPFVSERAAKTLDIVTRPAPSSYLKTLTSF